VFCFQQLQQQQLAVPEETEGDDNDSGTREEEAMGIPHLQVDASSKASPAWQKIIDSGKLPSVEDVRLCSFYIFFF
jgi:hypothetical protein